MSVSPLLRQLQPEFGDTFVDVRAIVSAGRVSRGTLGVALAAIRFPLMRCHALSIAQSAGGAARCVVHQSGETL